jgi:hypothetical protein
MQVCPSATAIEDIVWTLGTMTGTLGQICMNAFIPESKLFYLIAFKPLLIPVSFSKSWILYNPAVTCITNLFAFTVWFIVPVLTTL